MAVNTAAMDGEAALGRKRAIARLANIRAGDRHGASLRRWSLARRRGQILRKQECRLHAPSLSPSAVAVLDKYSFAHSHHNLPLCRSNCAL